MQQPSSSKCGSVFGPPAEALKNSRQEERDRRFSLPFPPKWRQFLSKWSPRRSSGGGHSGSASPQRLLSPSPGAIASIAAISLQDVTQAFADFDYSPDYDPALSLSQPQPKPQPQPPVHWLMRQRSRSDSRPISSPSLSPPRLLKHKKKPVLPVIVVEPTAPSVLPSKMKSSLELLPEGEQVNHSTPVRCTSPERQPLAGADPLVDDDDDHSLQAGGVQAKKTKASSRSWTLSPMAVMGRELRLSKAKNSSIAITASTTSSSSKSVNISGRRASVQEEQLQAVRRGRGAKGEEKEEPAPRRQRGWTFSASRSTPAKPETRDAISIPQISSSSSREGGEAVKKRRRFGSVVQPVFHQLNDRYNQ